MPQEQQGGFLGKLAALDRETIILAAVIALVAIVVYHLVFNR